MNESIYLVFGDLHGRILPAFRLAGAWAKEHCVVVPLDAIIPDAGSQEILEVIRAVQPTFAFFGHHKGRGRRIEGDFVRTQVYHLSGMELRQAGHHAEEGSVGVLKWSGEAGSFDYVDPSWLRSFTRHNWRHR